MGRPSNDLWNWLQGFVSSLQVRRISTIENVNEVIETFSHKQHINSLVNYLKSSALKEDSENTKAVYLIQDSDGNLLAYFSLRCGLLYRPNIKHPEQVSDELDQLASEIENLVQISIFPDEEALLDLIEQAVQVLKSNYLYDKNTFSDSISYLERPEDFSDQLRTVKSEYVDNQINSEPQSDSDIEIFDHLLELFNLNDSNRTFAPEMRDLVKRMTEATEIQIETALGTKDHQKEIIELRKSWLKDNGIPDSYYDQKVKIQHSSVEVSHFCINENYNCPAELETIRDALGWRLGKILFWNIITDKIIEISKLLGMNFVYLFAADSSGTSDDSESAANSSDLRHQNSDDENQELRKLVLHYRHDYNFCEANRYCLGVVQEEYDRGCHLMVQELNELIRNQSRLFDRLRHDLSELDKDSLVPAV